MQISDPLVTKVLLFLNEELKEKKSVSFNDVIANREFKKISVKEIGKSLEFLRRNGYVKADSRFGCSELLEFNALMITGSGKEYISKL